MISNNLSAPRIDSGLPGLDTLKDTAKGNKADFLQALQNELGKTVQPHSPKIDSGVKFSNHAIDRIQSRSIQFKNEDLIRLNEAVDKAAQKGSREALILMGDNAFVVSVKNKMVITAMDKAMMKENVFTNIDSTVVL